MNNFFSPMENTAPADQLISTPPLEEKVEIDQDEAVDALTVLAHAVETKKRRSSQSEPRQFACTFDDCKKTFTQLAHLRIHQVFSLILEKTYR